MMLGLKRPRRSSSTELTRVLGDFDLPTIPAVVSAAIDRISGPDGDLNGVAEIVVTDPGLSAKVLSIVNSAAYAPRNPIAGVHQAVMMLGRNRMESLLISLAASGAANAGAASGFRMNEFWLDAAWRSTTAASFAERFDRGRRTEHFTAALLKDIAIPILFRCQPRYRAVYTHWRAGAGELADLEHQAFGWTHTEVAGWMFETWGFPDALRDAVIESARPEDTKVGLPIVQIVVGLVAPRELDEVIGDIAHDFIRLYDISFDEAVRMIEIAREEASGIARSLA